MHRISRALAAKVSILVAVTAAFAPAAVADPTVSSDPTSLSQPTTTIVAHYRHPYAGHVMKVNQTSTIGGGIGSHSMGVSATFNVQRAGTVQYCPVCPVQPHPIEQSFHADLMEDGSLDATGGPGQSVFGLPAVDANGNPLGSTVGQVISALLSPPWNANRDARLSADQGVINGPLPELSGDLPPVEVPPQNGMMGTMMIVPWANLAPWLSRCMILGSSAATISAGIVLLHREIWRGGNQQVMGLKKAGLFAAYVGGATTLLAQWIACNTEANNLALLMANTAGALSCSGLGLTPPAYATCVSAVSAELYPTFRGILTAAVAAYTTAIVSMFAAAGVYFGF